MSTTKQPEMSEIHGNGPQSPTSAIQTLPTAPSPLKRAIPEPIPASFDSRGFHYRQIARKERVALYSQIDRAIKDPHVTYEVVRIQNEPEREMFGNVIPAHEAMPGNELWGQQGWTFTSEEKAWAKFKELTT
jgi:hypothetical protein